MDADQVLRDALAFLCARRIGIDKAISALQEILLGREWESASGVKPTDPVALVPVRASGGDAQKLEAFRKRHSIGARKLAQVMGCSVPSFYRIVRGERAMESSEKEALDRYDREQMKPQEPGRTL